MGERLSRKGACRQRREVAFRLGSARSGTFRALVVGSWASVFCGSCGASVPLVPSGPHPPNVVDEQRVGFPPPPARVEVLPLQRRDECAWRDGHWEWDGQGWRWSPGAWVVPPPGCYYAPPESHWVRMGGSAQLFYRAPRWYPDPETNTLGRCEEPRACTSLLPENEQIVDVGPPPVDRPQRLPTAR